MSLRNQISRLKDEVENADPEGEFPHEALRWYANLSWWAIWALIVLMIVFSIATGGCLPAVIAVGAVIYYLIGKALGWTRVPPME